MGPNFDPCGASYLIYFADDFLPLIEHQVEKKGPSLHPCRAPHLIAAERASLKRASVAAA